MNRNSYNRIASQWDAARAAFSGKEREYVDALLGDLPVPSEILDLGCGTGRPVAEYVLSRGHHVTGVDQASELLALARARFPNATWIESRLQDFECHQQYAAVVCWDALFHVERSAHTAILATIAKCLKPGGKLVLTVGGSGCPAFTDFMFGEEFFYDSHPPDMTLRLVEQADLEPFIAEFVNLPTAGRDKGRYAIVARKK